MFAFFFEKHYIIIKSRTVRLTSMYDLHHDRKIIFCYKCSCLKTSCTSTHRNELQNFSKIQKKNSYTKKNKTEKNDGSQFRYILFISNFFSFLFSSWFARVIFFLSWSLYIENKVVNSIWFSSFWIRRHTELHAYFTYAHIYHKINTRLL